MYVYYVYMCFVLSCDNQDNTEKTDHHVVRHTNVYCCPYQECNHAVQAIPRDKKVVASVPDRQTYPNLWNW